VGCELVDDPLGGLVFRKIPDPATIASSWFYDESELSTGLPGYKRNIHAEDVYNGVIINASAPWLIYPIQGVAWDTNPSSPTYYKGQFGMKPKTIDNATVSTQAQADAAAASELINVLGITEEIDFEAMPNPAQDVGDVVTVGSNILQVDAASNLMEEFFMPFDVNTPMRGVMRRHRAA